MRIAIVTNFIYPESLGGTELFCIQLAHSLLLQGHQVYWVIPNFSSDSTIDSIAASGLHTVRFAAIATGMKPDISFVSASFLREIKKRNIDVVHFNEFGGFEGISHNLLDDTKKAGFKTVVTLHLVHYICHTGKMRYGGIEPCNGEVIPARCASCKLFSEFSVSDGLNYFLARSFTGAFNIIDKHQLHLFPKSRRFINNFKKKLPFIAALKNSADVIVSLTKWFSDVLIANGIPDNKIKYLPQVSPSYTPELVQILPVKRTGYVFIGRLSREKGIELLIGAAKLLQKQSPDIFIDVYGPTRSGKFFSGDFLKQQATLSNINYRGVLDPGEVMPTIAKYKAVLLPSIVSEMAPLIITEANKLKIPVIASDVSGSVELINEYDCGLIFKYKDVNDFVRKILTIEIGESKFKFVQPLQNNFDNVASRYTSIYESI